ncbi:uncharacterized protein LOC135509583 isoform X2 [Oncorhynchus masou masou]|uniref:uncharacterized protein LOC135509583 isoform X2 n=1 Tax=Oncorhynchus masou masou TaxID=90313 RepID=UPI0031838420
MKSERVESPVLTVDSNSTINGICNVTVTCRGQNTSVTSSCNSSTCSQVGRERKGAETSTVPLLSVYLAGGSIICNHSNQVSWANDTKKIVQLCSLKSESERDEENQNYNVGIIIFIIIIIIIFVGCVLIACQKLNKGRKEESINTDYASVGIPGNSQVGGEEQMSPGPASPTIYSMVGHPQPPAC